MLLYEEKKIDYQICFRIAWIEVCVGVFSQIWTKTEKENVMLMIPNSICIYTNTRNFLFLCLLKLMPKVLRAYWEEVYGQYLILWKDVNVKET